MSRFKRPTEAAYLKAGFMGLSGSGKTYTAMMLACTLAKREGIKEVYFLDTEGGSEYLVHRAEQAGINLIVDKTRAFSDLLNTFPQNPDMKILIIDSITHYWEELKSTYLNKQQAFANKIAARRGREAYKKELSFPDWAYLKGEWAKFTTLYLNSPVHILLCGRLGYEWDFKAQEEGGKKELVKEGVKMKAEGETGYEASLLIYMKRHMRNADKPDEGEHLATVLKDRFGVIQGKQMLNPRPQFFMPHIELLVKRAQAEPAYDESRTSEALVKQEVEGYAENTSKKLQSIIVDQIKCDLECAYPGTSKEAKATKGKMLMNLFGTSSYDAIGVKSKEVLRRGYDEMRKLTKENPDEDLATPLNIQIKRPLKIQEQTA